MKLSLRSLGGSIKDYKHMLEKKLDFDNIYNVIKDEMIMNAWGEGKHKHIFLDELQIEVGSLEELFAIFSEFDEGMGYGGHITVDVKDNIVYILDTWIE